MRGLLVWDSIRCTGVADGSVSDPDLLTKPDLLGLRPALALCEREERREFEAELRGRRAERTGEDSREDIAEFVDEAGADSPGTVGVSLGIWDAREAWTWELNVERGTSIMSPSLVDRRDADVAASSFWALLDPPEVPLR